MPSSKSIKLLIADDHGYLIDGVKLSLEDSEVEVVSHTMMADDIVGQYLASKPDVVLMDIMFGQDKTGLDILDELLAVAPEAKIIVFTQYDQDELIQRAYAKGAKAFLPKSTRVDELLDAIRTAVRDEIYFTDAIARRLAALVTRAKSADRDPTELLTQKELDVFRLLAQGFTEQEIAQKLNFHQRTITATKAVIRDKLGISRPAEFTMAALKYKLIHLG